MDEPNPPKPSLLLGACWPHLIHQCLGPPHSLPKTAAGSLHALSYNNATQSPLVAMGHPISAPAKIHCIWTIANPVTYLIHGPCRPTTPNGIHIQSAVFPQYTGQTDWWLTGGLDDKPVPVPAYTLWMIAMQLIINYLGIVRYIVQSVASFWTELILHMHNYLSVGIDSVYSVIFVNLPVIIVCSLWVS